MNRSAAEVEAEVEASRSQLDANVEALKQKMTPGQLFDEAARVAGGSGQQIAAKFVEQAKANPMPLAVMGLGLAWLMMSNNKPASTRYSPDYSGDYGEPRSFAAEGGYGAISDSYDASAGGEGLKDKAQDKIQEVGDKASSLLAGAKDKLGAGASSVGQGGRAAVQNLGAVADSARQKVGQAGQHVQRTFLDALESEPLLIAGLGVVVGAAIGAALPATSAEDRLMGDKRDRILNKGKDLAQTGLQQASSAAQAAYGSVKSELQSGEGDDRDLSERVESAARSGVQAARDELQGGAPH